MRILLITTILQSLVPFIFPQNRDTVKLLFMGDIMQHMPQVQAASLQTDKSHSHSTSYDYSSYFKHLQEMFKQADIISANMETTFAPPPYSGYPCFCSPPDLAKECLTSGINLLMLANNHTCDKGSAGIRGTLNLLDSLQIRNMGVYRNSEEEKVKNPLMIKVRNITIAFLNYTYGTNGLPVPKPYIVKQLDSNQIKIDLTKTRLLYPDYTIICVHWGYEYHLKHSKEQEMWEKLFYRNGADVIVGSHPHVPQDINVIKDESGSLRHITTYSLGNLISNMSDENTRIGILLDLRLIKDAIFPKKIIEYDYQYLWAAHPSDIEGNYTILPINKFINSPEKFATPAAYQKMEKHYLKFR